MPTWELKAAKVFNLNCLLDDWIQSDDLFKFQPTETQKLDHIYSVNLDENILIKNRKISCLQLLCDSLYHPTNWCDNDLSSLKLLSSLINSSTSLNDAHVQSLNQVHVSVRSSFNTLQLFYAISLDWTFQDSLSSSCGSVKSLRSDTHSRFSVINWVGLMSKLRLVNLSLELQLFKLRF